MKAVIAAVLVILSGGMAMAQNTGGGAGGVAEAGNRFGLDLYGRLASQEGNLFVSPYSIDTALLMVNAGAAGGTADEMRKVLHLQDMPGDEVNKEVGDWISGLQADPASKGYELNVANAIWVQKGFNILPAYSDLLTTHYQAGINSANFADGSATAGEINDWVARQTKDRIKDLISPGSLTADMRLALVNAIYFKGDWKTPFNAKLTHDGQWHLDGGDIAPKPAAMMQQEDDFSFYQDDQLSALQMPYKGDQVAMLLLLPKKGTLADLEKSLSMDMLKQATDGLASQEVVVAMPKFSMRGRYELGDVLKAMGMGGAFSDAADFSGMDGRRDLTISDVIHATFVQVDETGTEAAGATGITMRTMAARENVRFIADHPFLVLIRDVDSGAILFMGRVSDPTGE